MSIDNWNEIGQAARVAALELGATSSAQKNKALEGIAAAIVRNQAEILDANGRDLQAGEESGMTTALQDRLRLTSARLNSLIESVTQVIDLSDPVGTEIERWERPNGLQISKVRVPLGVIGIIYEARPNVTVDAGVLCLKTGNAVILRGSSSAINSNVALTRAIQEGLQAAEINPMAVQLVRDTSRESVQTFLKQKKYIDVIIPRGGSGLINFVVDNSAIPVLETGAGVCHVFVDASADLNMAREIIINAKTQRPSVCNAIETVLVERSWAKTHLQELLSTLSVAGVTIRGCQETCAAYPQAIAADESDWSTEYLDLRLSVKIVDNVQAAVEHINHYGTRHSECILSSDPVAVRFFQQHIDAAAVYHNASTRFTDGFEFGFGAEIGICTQKLHARGPMGLNELTTYKYLINGQGQIRS